MRWRESFWPNIRVALFFLILIGAISWPAPLFLSRHLIGNNIDNWIFFWNNWWTRQALATDYDWSFTPLLFYPRGVSLTTHSISHVHSLLAVLLEPLFGPIAAYNIVVLGSLWIGAVGMFLLVRALTRSPGAALLSGLLFALAPYHLSQALAHVHLGAIHWWPFYALFLRATLRRPDWRHTLGAAAFAALTVWSGLQLALLLALWTVVYVPWFLLARPGDERPDAKVGARRIGQLCLMLLVAVFLSLPILIPLAQARAALTGASTAFQAGATGQTDLLAYLIPPTYHPLWGTAVQPLYDRFVANRTTMAYLGFVAVGLALYGGWRRRRQASFWAFSSVAWLLLAAGSAPRINGEVYPSIPLPFRLLEPSFPFSALRNPDRFNLLLVFSLAVLAGYGAAALLRRRRWLLVPLVALLLLEYLPTPLPMWEPVPTSEQLLRLPEGAGSGVIDYPMGYTNSKLWLYYQTLHERPLVEGHTSRYSAATYEYIARQPVLRALYQAGEKPPNLPEETFAPVVVPPPALGIALRDLVSADIGLILLHRAYASEAQAEHFHRVLPAVPVYQDETLAVVDLSRLRPWHYGDAPVAVAPYARLLQAVPSLADDRQALALQLLFQLDAPPQSLDCQVVAAGHSSSVTTFFSPGHGWQPGDLDWQTVLLPLPGSLAGGRYALSLACDGSPTVNLVEQLLQLPDGHRLLSRDFPALDFQSEILLPGLYYWTEGATLHLALPWQARRSPADSYKLFVHLLDSTGAIVRQYDALPCNWGCPTDGWSAGQWIDDRAVLDLWGLPAGEYRLALGLYNPDSGERLKIQSTAGAVAPDNYFVTPDSFRITRRP